MYNELEKTFSFVPSDQKSERFGLLSQFAASFANLMVALAISISFIAFAYSFVLLINSAGDKMALDKAKRALLWSSIALVVSVLSVALKGTLVTLMGLSGSPAEVNPNF